MHRRSRAAATAALTLAIGGLAVPVAQAEDGVLPTIAINEVESSGGSPVDWIELTNTGDAPVDVSGWILKDNDDARTLAIAPATVIAPGGFLAVDVDVTGGFGLGGADTARVFLADGTTLVDSYAWTAHADTTYGRCPDGVGDFATTASSTKGAANECPVPVTVETALKVNEVESSGTAEVLGGADFIELVNTADQPLDVNGVIVMDGKIEDAATDAYTLTGLDPIPAGGFLVLNDAEHFAFGLGKGDTAQLFSAGTPLEDIAAGTATPFEAYTWGDAHALQTYGRCPDGTGEFVDTAAATPGAANACEVDPVDPPVEEPVELSTTLAINEVESNGDDTDWVEVMNLTDADIDISGWGIKDNDDTRTDVVPAGSVVPAGGLLVIDQQSATYAEGFTFGLGNGDMFRLYDLSGTLVAKTTWDAHALVSWSRCPDGTGDWIDAPFSTKGAPNSCSLPIRINEVESSGDATDWVELTNLGASAVDLGGVVIKDDDDTHAFTIPAGTMLGSGGFVAFDLVDFGLGGEDSVRLYDATGALLDSYAWASHAGTTYGRCPDGLGDFETTASSTKGAANSCAGIVNALPWPGGAGVDVLDAEPTFGGDMSGIDYADGTLWAVQNGDGLLYRMTPAGEITGEWTLTYPGGTGTVDAEGVHVAADGAVYVSSERDNSASSVSRPAVLRFEATGTSGTLVATDEWNLAADFPGLAANGGLEGVTWIPDAWLVDGGLVDEATGAGYDPAGHPGHGDGLYVVAVEGTASAYAYALMADGGFQRVATLSTEGVAFSLVADVQFDAERSQLWVVCDEACDGRIATYTLVDGAFEASALYERPAGTANIANEGFAVADSTLCVDGAVPTFYVDDADTDGFSLRSGTLPCVDAVEPGLVPGAVAVTGKVRVGSTLTASTEGWPAGATLAYQWRVAGKAVSGATKATFTPKGGAVGRNVTVRVTATLGDLAPVARTSAPVTVKAGVLEAGHVRITGTRADGSTLKAAVREWPATARLTYQWRANGKAIPGATYTSLKVTPRLEGARITVKVTAKRWGYTPVSKVSARTAAIG
ncbi:lamin tail domain-containing protein [Demequina silvatica]|uniref:lamin tail domain-containing protein n=1 Tax=Demequina silvatica TaxID=1638988 RepID=UPI0007864E5A|nr:lamin tail domain-containing protein [Demequina silvatica]